MQLRGVGKENEVKRVTHEFGPLCNLPVLSPQKLSTASYRLLLNRGEMSLWPHDKTARVKYNKLTGSIPNEMNQLSKLDVLLLEHNDFTGDANAICNAGFQPDLQNILFQIVTLAFNVTVAICAVTAVSKIFAMLAIGTEVWILFGSTAIVEVAIATIWDLMSSLSLNLSAFFSGIKVYEQSLDCSLVLR